MKILVIGNGFDLAHYLPTSYNHFMGVMQAIEQLSDEKTEIGFEDLFGALALDEKWFFGRTRELYAVESIKFDLDIIKDIKEKLKESSWYAYFKDHLVEIDTWIDFETKIGEVLEVVSYLLNEFEKKKIELGSFPSFEISEIKNGNNHCVFIERSKADLLRQFNFLVNKKSEENVKKSRSISWAGIAKEPDWYELNPDFIAFYKKEIIGLKHQKVLDELKKDLNSFIEIFDTYFSAIIKKFSSRKPFVDLSNIFEGLIELYSFNYTSTFITNYINYKELVQVSYLHGQAGCIDKKIVLGISELPNNILKQHKAYGFVKYHQKLFNDTDYSFLKEHHLLTKHKDPEAVYDIVSKLEIVIWGHSLDVSDQEYIKEIFSFNTKRHDDLYVEVVILFHDESSKFSMLANLLHILGKKLIEKWMKRKWLLFEKVPDIYKLNTEI
ncbi:AbiH family protein [Aquirhabdus sp.]|uniref:AbiH family protein n=1 Tax=Aquirhabdus sp. TaxID=2824160 RepID=UPI00396C2D1E